MNSRKVALITGGSKGIGAETAVEFARRGYHVAITARSEEKLHQTAARVRDAGGEAMVLAGDLADLNLVQSFVEQAAARFGRIDVLVNNAAWREVVAMRDISIESWERTIRIGLTAPAFLAKWAAVHMEKIGGGVVINVSSIQSEAPAGISPAYTASKGGLDTLTYDLALMYGPRNIRVVAINPGGIDTEVNDEYASPEGDSAAKEVRAASEAMIALGRWGTAPEIAKTIVWLAGDEASFITGTCLFADGGNQHCYFPLSVRKRLLPGNYA